eukprot:gene21948-19505_t
MLTCDGDGLSWLDWVQQPAWRDRVEAYRNEATANGWGEGAPHAPLAPQLIAQFIEYCALMRGGPAVPWPWPRTAALVEDASAAPLALRPQHPLLYEMYAWGVSTMAALGPRSRKPILSES